MEVPISDRRHELPVVLLIRRPLEYAEPATVPRSCSDRESIEPTASTDLAMAPK